MHDKQLELQIQRYLRWRFIIKNLCLIQEAENKLDPKSGKREIQTDEWKLWLQLSCNNHLHWILLQFSTTTRWVQHMKSEVDSSKMDIGLREREVLTQLRSYWTSSQEVIGTDVQIQGLSSGWYMFLVIKVAVQVILDLRRECQEFTYRQLSNQSPGE